MNFYMKRFVDYLPLFLSLGLMVLLSHYYFWQTGDDSYIYFRYVERAAAGKWWSWTDQLPPVEGYSSPLWYLLLVALAKTGLTVEMAARGLGLLFSLLALAGTWILARILSVGQFLSGMACLLLVLNHGFHYWATAGLETSFYMAIYVWAAIGLVRNRYWIFPVALIGVARPEGPFLLVAVLVCLLVVRRGSVRVSDLFLVLLPTVAWIAVRMMVYGVPLPNTYYAKATGDSFGQIMSGLIYSSPLLFPLCLVWVWWLYRRIRLGHYEEGQMIVLGMVSLLTGIIVIGGGDYMHHFRLLLPLWGLLFAVLASQLVVYGGFSRILAVLTLIPFLLMSVPPVQLLSALRGEQLSLLSWQEGEMIPQSLRMAEEIRKRYPPGLLIAVNHAGALPWALPEYRFIDMVGLNDLHIARQPGRIHKKHDAGYVLAQKPDLIVLNSRVEPGTDGIWYHKGYWVGETALVEHPLFVDYQPTDLVYRWGWKMLFPYSLVFPEERSSWILLYERKR